MVVQGLRMEANIPALSKTSPLSVAGKPSCNLCNHLLDFFLAALLIRGSNIKFLLSRGGFCSICSAAWLALTQPNFRHFRRGLSEGLNGTAWLGVLRAWG